MKANVHPQYFENATVICVCGNRFTTGSTQEVIHVELCSNCHPFYTGEQRFVDTASRIQKFQKKQEVAKVHQAKVIKKKEELKKRDDAPKTLREMLLNIE
ncbi:MAG TPA: 50S ribosomal protein L31 [Patescibacteria group bacterium]|nr:50S ribosomal protein L31 [Patescibacteria group bacterium]